MLNNNSTPDMVLLFGQQKVQNQEFTIVNYLKNNLEKHILIFIFVLNYLMYLHSGINQINARIINKI
jgi:hypothetical protein